MEEKHHNSELQIWILRRSGHEICRLCSVQGDCDDSDPNGNKYWRIIQSLLLSLNQSCNFDNLQNFKKKFKEFRSEVYEADIEFIM